jgi:hypothetical protein
MRIDNLSTVSGDIGLINSASFLDGSVPTYIQAQNGSSQSIPHNTGTTITNWTNVFAQNAAEWNPTTGVFTATKAGVYVVSAGLLYNDCTCPSTNTEFSVTLGVTTSYHIAQTTSLIKRPTGFATGILVLAIGNTFTVSAYHNQGGSVSLNSEAWSNSINIRELPHRLTRA